MYIPNYKSWLFSRGEDGVKKAFLVYNTGRFMRELNIFIVHQLKPLANGKNNFFHLQLKVLLKFFRATRYLCVTFPQTKFFAFAFYNQPQVDSGMHVVKCLHVLLHMYVHMRIPHTLK